MAETIDLPDKNSSAAKVTSADSSKTPNLVVNETQEALDGYVLDPARYPENASGLKLSEDGKYVLIPQPTDWPADPLNWNSRKKAVSLIIVSFIAALADYTGGTAIITVIPQSLCVMPLLKSATFTSRINKDQQ